MATNFDRKIAAEVFIKILISHVRNGIIQDIKLMLEEGLPGRQPPENKIVLHHWFQQLGNQEREYIHEIIKETVDSTLFSALVVLDGAAGRPLKNKLSDYALYLQIYLDENMEALDSPQVRVRLNPPGSTEDLHDIFQWTVEEMENSGSG